MNDANDTTDSGPEDRSEALAFSVVPMLLGEGVRCEPYDHSGRQGAVDALLHFPDGEIAALEVTSDAGDGMRQLYSLIDGDNQTLPNPGEWTWQASVSDPRDLPQLRDRLPRLIPFCEANGIRYPGHAYEHMTTNADVAWLIGSSAELFGSPDLPKMDGERERPLFVMPGPTGGSVDETLSGFAAAIDAVISKDHVQKRVSKLARSGHAGRHLFVHIDSTALPFSVAYALAQRDVVPPTTPTLPGDLTHLWFLVTFSPWIFLLTSSGLQRFPR